MNTGGKMELEFERPLHLVSPHMYGPQERDAQFLLTHNPYGNFHPGPIDGDWGSQSAGATYRAKYWLGYLPGFIDRQFGRQLYRYLLPVESNMHLPLPRAMRVVRAARLAKAKPTAKQEALKLALADAALHIHEDPWGSNRQRYGVWYGLNGYAWCMMSGTYWYVQAGVPGFKRSAYWSYVPTLVEAARHGSQHVALTSDPEPGDGVSYTTISGPNEHFEIFDRWVQKGYSFMAVGGNTSDHEGVDDNGGAVIHQLRYVSHVTHFIRVGL